jgi:hypothetical protein
LWNPSVLAFTAALFAGVAIHEYAAARFAPSAEFIKMSAGARDNRTALGMTD